MNRRLVLGRYRQKRGFTLIELMVVLVVLGSLMTILIVSLQDSGIDEKQARLKMLKSKAVIETSLFEFKAKLGRYPAEEEGLMALVSAPAGIEATSYPSGGFLKEEQIKDPWGNVFQYRINDSGRYEIISLGADGAEGGEGTNADINLDNI